MKPPLMIRHRVNKISELDSLKKEWGVEIDIRSSEKRLELVHDPHVRGESLKSYAAELKKRGIQGPVVLNTKEDGLEPEILKIMRYHKLANFFFLDVSMPTLVRLTNAGMRKVAVRVSEYESIETALRFKNRAEWIWLDSFTGKPPAISVARHLARYFRVCLVSPELQHFESDQIPLFKPLLPFLDAVCTKHPSLWQ